MELSTSQYGKPIRCDLSNLGYVTTSKQILMVRIIIPFVEFTHQFGSCLPTLKLLAIRSHEEVLRDRKSTRLNSSHVRTSRMPSSA